jgi:hypothetical protein
MIPSPTHPPCLPPHQPNDLTKLFSSLGDGGKEKKEKYLSAEEEVLRPSTPVQKISVAENGSPHPPAIRGSLC